MVRPSNQISLEYFQRKMHLVKTCLWDANKQNSFNAWSQELFRKRPFCPQMTVESPWNSHANSVTRQPQTKWPASCLWQKSYVSAKRGCEEWQCEREIDTPLSCKNKERTFMSCATNTVHYWAAYTGLIYYLNFKRFEPIGQTIVARIVSFLTIGLNCSTQILISNKSPSFRDHSACVVYGGALWSLFSLQSRKFSIVFWFLKWPTN